MSALRYRIGRPVILGPPNQTAGVPIGLDPIMSRSTIALPYTGLWTRVGDAAEVLYHARQGGAMPIEDDTRMAWRLWVSFSWEGATMPTDQSIQFRVRNDTAGQILANVTYTIFITPSPVRIALLGGPTFAGPRGASLLPASDNVWVLDYLVQPNPGPLPADTGWYFWGAALDITRV